METPLLQTKLYIPPPRPDAQRVPRPRLIGRLNAGLRRNHGFARKLTLISAPAGFGKTTLVSEWGHVLGSASSPIAVAWLSLDEGDDDLARFLTYLIAALQTTDDGIGQGLLSVLQSPGTVNAELILTTLLNEIAALPDSVVLVLDDYHLLESHAIDQAISFTLNHLPSQLHLVIATRSDPNIPLARLRGRGQVNELRAADLRFTAQESGAFLRGIVGADMSPEQIATLNARTEGWAVGLQMAAVSMRGVEDIPAFISTFAGDHRYIVDYLVDEVLAQCSPATREFLLQTSILDRMSAPLCDALSGRSDGQAILEQLEQDNLFTIALDQRRQWYRFHHLFAQLLRHRLLQTYPERVEALHARASHWLDEHGFTHQAITHALALEDKQLAVELIERHATGLLFQGRAQVDSMLDWFKQLPEILPRKHPLLSVFHVWVLVFSSPFKNADQAEQELSLIEQSLDKADVDQATKRTVAGHIASIRAMLAQPPIRTDHDPHAVLALFQKAQNLLPMSETKIRSDLLIGIAYEYMHLEDTKAAHNASKTAFAQARAADNQLVALVSLRNDALVACHQGEIDQAIEILENGMTLFDQRHTGKGQYYPGLEILSSALGYMLVECGELERADGELAQGGGSASMV